MGSGFYDGVWLLQQWFRSRLFDTLSRFILGFVVSVMWVFKSIDFVFGGIISRPNNALKPTVLSPLRYDKTAD